MATLFIPSSALPIRREVNEVRRCKITTSISTRRQAVVSLSKKGPNKTPSSKPKKKESRRARTSSTSSSPQSSPSATSVNETENKGFDLNEPFVPRGPTMRAEYERKGLIEPEILDRDAGVLPEQVANRMIRRILVFGGIPLSFLFIFFALYFVLKYKYDITVLPVVVASSTLGTVGLATGGITYGILSSSWDEEKGSLLGWKEAKTNFIRAKDGLVGAREREKVDEELDRIDQLAEEIEKEENKKMEKKKEEKEKDEQ